MFQSNFLFQSLLQTMKLETQSSIHFESTSLDTESINIEPTKPKRICLVLCAFPLLLLLLTMSMAMMKVKPLIINFQPEPEQLSLQQIRKMREDSLEKNFRSGLQQYYESIQESIKLVKITKSNKEGYSILVNSLEECEMNIFQKSVQSLLQNFQHESISQIIWVLKTNQNSKFLKWLEDYLKKQKLQSALIEQIMDSSYDFLINNISPHSEYFLLLTNEMIVQKNEIDYSAVCQNGPLAFMGTFNQFDEKKNFSSLSKKQIINSVYFFKSSLLKLITPLNFAYQNVYTFDELVILPIITLTQICNRLQIKELVKLNNSFQNQNRERNLTQFSFRSLAFNNDPYICFVAFPTVPTENSAYQIIRYLNKLQQQQIKNEEISKRSSIYISIVYEREDSMSEVLIKALNLVQKGVKMRLRIRQSKVYGSLQEYEVAFSYCPEGSVLFSSRLNIEPFVQQIYKQITDQQLCHNNHNMLIPKYIQKQKNVSLNKISNLTLDSFISIFNEYFFHAQIICSSLIRQFRIGAFQQDEVYFYETQASYSMRAAFKSLSTHLMSQNYLFKVVSERKRTEAENKGLDLLAMRDYLRDLEQPLKYSELNNIGYKRNPKNIIPKIIHQVWLSNQKTPSPMKIALAETIKQTNPQFQYRLWTWKDVTRKNFPITFDSILRLLLISKRNYRNLLALVVDLMRIELLYRHGGFYMDYKFQGVRSFQPFLKYEQIFYIIFQNEVTNSMIASTPGNRYFYKILKDFSRPEYFNQGYRILDGFFLTGGKKIFSLYTQKQILTQALNFHQYAADGLKPCQYTQRTQAIEKDQKKFEGIAQFQVKMKYIIYIPCKLNKHKYLELYDVQGRTYFSSNKDKDYFL